MKLNITYRHIDATDAMEKVIRDKAEHLKKFFRGKMEVNWVCEVTKNEHRCEVNVHAGNEFFHAHAVDDNLYKTFDIVLKKMEAQLRKFHDRKKDKIHHHHEPEFLTNPLT